MKALLLILFSWVINFGFTQEVIPTKREALTIAMNNGKFDVFMKKAKVGKEVNVQMNDIVSNADTLKKKLVVLRKNISRFGNIMLTTVLSSLLMIFFQSKI